jgi:hypothetical protein
VGLITEYVTRTDQWRHRVSVSCLISVAEAVFSRAEVEINLDRTGKEALKKGMKKLYIQVFLTASKSADFATRHLLDVTTMGQHGPKHILWDVSFFFVLGDRPVRARAIGIADFRSTIPWFAHISSERVARRQSHSMRYSVFL